MERAEEATYAEVGRLKREVIEPRLVQYHGRLIKTTGDGMLTEFASPIAAVRCAVEIQDHLYSMLDALELRIGLNLGDVIVQEDGDVYGEGINMAARLEGIADPGGILISSKVHGEVEGKLDLSFEDRGERQLKNISKPVRAYAIRARTHSSAPVTNRGKPLPLPDKASIAVLPFQNMSGDPEQEYFADGIVEDIITALSRFLIYLQSQARRHETGWSRTWRSLRGQRQEGRRSSPHHRSIDRSLHRSPPLGGQI
jgi:adenylate cyclase